MKSLKTLHIAEIIITILQALIITFFGVLQFIPCFRYCLPLPCITETISGIYIQVDATILTITIALMALITGLLPDSYMGISYGDYFLNVRPRIYKQIVIIILSMVYFGFGCIALWMGWHYMITAMLFCEIMLIIMSVLCIYGIFMGQDVIRDEIRIFAEQMQITGRG